MGSNDAYEPPAAIQNAMLTKDKKPFTYTPGMGGKLDLSQIRSPRMARRVAKNANDEGIEGPPKSALESKPSPAASTAPNLFVQPQVAIPVFPTNVPPQPQVSRVPQPTAVNRMPSNGNNRFCDFHTILFLRNRIIPEKKHYLAHRVNCSSPTVADKPAEASKNITKIDTKLVPITATSSQSNTPESPNTPTQVTLAKAPTPWLQNKNKPQEELPEWAKRASVNKAAAGPSECPPSPTSPVYIQVQPQSRQSPPQRVQVKPKEQEQQGAQYQQPPLQYQAQQKPQQIQQSPQQTQPTWQQRQNTEPPTSQRTNPQTHQQERIIPIRVSYKFLARFISQTSVIDWSCVSSDRRQTVRVRCETRARPSSVQTTSYPSSSTTMGPIIRATTAEPGDSSAKSATGTDSRRSFVTTRTNGWHLHNSHCGRG